jgi:sugar/nucleoside kinase (ribokinase family)
MSAVSGNALLDLVAIGPAEPASAAVSAALAAGRAGGRVAFIPSGGAPAHHLAGALRAAAVPVREACPLLIRAARALLLDSLLWDAAGGSRTATAAASVARAAGRQVVLALSDAAAIHRHRLGLLAFLRGGADLLLCRSLEACALYDTHRIDTVVPQIRRDCRAAVLDRGSRGLILIDDASICLVDRAPADDAGDAYAGAIDLAQSWGEDPAENGRQAGDFAAAVILRSGANRALPGTARRPQRRTTLGATA